MWFIYIILCADGSFYTGSSNDIAKRFLVHQNGKGASYTRSHKPVKLIYSEQFNSKSEALKREIEIKGWSRDRKIKELRLMIKEE